MTPALKAMVEAMIAELNRQAQGGRPGPYVDDGVSKCDPEPDFNSILIDGRIDLEKVARAGLEAIKDQGDVYRPELTVAFAGMIAAILKDAP